MTSTVATPSDEMSIFEQTNISKAERVEGLESAGISADGGVNLEKLKKMEKYFPKEYQNRLEIILLQMEKQLKDLKKERKFLKSENTILKESNESNQFVISQLNTALTKATGRIKTLEDRMGVHDAIL